jgi:hypothetical protein
VDEALLNIREELHELRAGPSLAPLPPPLAAAGQVERLQPGAIRAACSVPPTLVARRPR